MKYFSKELSENKMKLEIVKQYFEKALDIILEIELAVDEVSKVLCLVIKLYASIDFYEPINNIGQ